MANCPECKEDQVSPVDNEYLKINKICWTCDHKKWKSKELSLKDFEAKEKKAFDSISEKLSKKYKEREGLA